MMNETYKTTRDRYQTIDIPTSPYVTSFDAALRREVIKAQGIQGGSEQQINGAVRNAIDVVYSSRLSARESIISVGELSDTFTKAGVNPDELARGVVSRDNTKIKEKVLSYFKLKTFKEVYTKHSRIFRNLRRLGIVSSKEAKPGEGERSFGTGNTLNK